MYARSRVTRQLFRGFSHARQSPTWTSFRMISSGPAPSVEPGQSADSTPRDPTETLRYPEPSTSNHHDLASFLQYADRTGLDPASTVYVGTHYEYTVAEALSKYGFSLRRIGGASDYGIDLLGTWAVPSSPTPLRVLLQCKATKHGTPPQNVRELEGAFAQAPPGWRGPGVIGLLVGMQAASKGVRVALSAGRRPVGFVTCSPAGEVRQMTWNLLAAENGLYGMGATMQYGPGGSQELVLSYNSMPLPLLRGGRVGGKEEGSVSTAG